jgi:hypothetical protein
MIPSSSSSLMPVHLVPCSFIFSVRFFSVPSVFPATFSFIAPFCLLLSIPSCSLLPAPPSSLLLIPLPCSSPFPGSPWFLLVPIPWSFIFPYSLCSLVNPPVTTDFPGAAFSCSNFLPTDFSETFPLVFCAIYFNEQLGELFFTSIALTTSRRNEYTHTYISLHYIYLPG